MINKIKYKYSFYSKPILLLYLMSYMSQVSEQLACGSCGSTAAAGTPYPDPNASGGVHGVLCEGNPKLYKLIRLVTIR